MADRPYRDLMLLFLKLGCIAFGGPAAHIALFEQEVVERRRWMTHEHFLDLIGATNLIPGPNSTEMTMHVGYERAGWPGLVLAGVSFILPAALITAVLAVLYVQYGAVPGVEPFLHGIKPAVLAVIVAAIWRLGRKALKNAQLGVIGAAVIAASIAGANEVAALLGGGVLGMMWLRWTAYRGESGPGAAAIAPLALAGAPAAGGAAAAAATTSSVPLFALFLFFLKIGAILYGSGYVLIAFIEGELVAGRGWLTQEQLLDAVAIGQFTPGPITTTATFIGYLLGGGMGALVATLGIFLPSFFFVALLNPIIPRLRRSPWSAAFLDAVNVASIALMVAVTIALGRSALTAWPAWLIAAAAVAASMRWKVNAAWLVVGGSVAGWLLRAWM